MNRNDFQQLAEDHLRHAKALLDAEFYSGAYYICGYAVECALKACICSRTNQFDFYAHPDIGRKAWSHKFANLMDVSGLEEEFEAARLGDSALGVHWNNVENWSEHSRYERRSQKDAEDLYSAVSDPVHGVLACIKRFW
jgi:HEPN domain-containing protein